MKLNQTKASAKVPILGDIPIIGGLFRSIDNNDTEKKLYVFLKARIVRPYEEGKLADLQRISDKYKEDFEEAERKFQRKENWPGVAPEPLNPVWVLEDL